MTLLPPLEHVSSGCLNCGSKPVTLPLDTMPHPGFGMLDLTCDGERPEWWEEFCSLVYWIDYPGEWTTIERRDGTTVEYYNGLVDHPVHPADDVTLREIEECVAEDSDHDWRLRIDAPLYDVVYQRQGPGEWVAVEKGLGFA